MVKDKALRYQPDRMHYKYGVYFIFTSPTTADHFF